MRTADTVHRFLNSCNARGLSPHTIAWYRHHLKTFIKAFESLPTTPGDIEAFLARQDGSVATRLANHQALRSLYRWVESRDRLPNPMDDILAPRRPRQIRPTLEIEQLSQVLDSASSPRDRALLTLLIDTGIRQGELATLLKGGISRETIAIKGKCGERLVPISQETQRLLLALAAETPGDYVFAGRGGHLSRSAIYRIVSSALRAAGISGIKMGAHRLRHAVGKAWLVAGGDLRSLQQLLGHADIRTTQIYAGLNIADTITKHAQFSPLRALHAAAEANNLSRSDALREVELILKGGKHDQRNQP